jgi:putative two-component system response regulator
LAERPKFRDEVNADYVRMIYLTSPLHDIGKVGIPDSVLLKPGRLSDREFEIMKQHTLIGAETLDAALREHPGAGFLRMGRDIALTHHERWDGAGYPHGLSGSDIPLCGRIITVADVYDALTAKRVYKHAFAHDVSRSIIVEEAGTHFDPDVVEAFLATEDEFMRVREKFADAGFQTDACGGSASREFSTQAVVI